MTRSEALHQLRRHAPALRQRGATSLYLFGSVLRDKAGPSSDLDIFVDYDPQKKFSLLDLANIKDFLEDQLGLPVDVTTRDSLHPSLKLGIESSAERVF